MEGVRENSEDLRDSVEQEISVNIMFSCYVASVASVLTSFFFLPGVKEIELLDYVTVVATHSGLYSG